ncbi:MAG: hypothetical protein IJB49_08370 [Clostridia bacterium]|nr:hypothetical protein [Clostridia bacterium]
MVETNLDHELRNEGTQTSKTAEHFVKPFGYIAIFILQFSRYYAIIKTNPKFEFGVT